LGKSYSAELKNLDSTYEWALGAPIDDLMAFVCGSRTFPLVSVGSGGSLTSAILASLLHQQAGRMSVHITPLETVSRSYLLHDVSALFFSARGRNHDILVSFESVAKEEPRQLMVLCAKKGSLLKHIADEYPYVYFLEFDLPLGTDGFLATHSLLSFAIFLIRAYKDCLSLSYRIPESLDSLVHPSISRHRFLSQLESDASALLKKDTLVVLYGKWSKPAAFDIESKFSEAALGNVQLTDYRNFAHGRHNWLAKNGDRTGIVAFITPEDEKIATRTLDLIPEKIPIVRLLSDSSGPIAALNLLVKTLYLVKVAGESKGIDPGRPGIPEFGIRIYNLRMPISLEKNPLLVECSPPEVAAISRKIRTHLYPAQTEGIIQFWVKAYRKFAQSIQEACYDSIVFDYDGTLCDPARRFTGASTEIGKLLTSLLEQGITVGVVTGRGKSVRDDLQRIVPKVCWSQVLVGYYNGSDIGLLSDNTHPDKNRDMDSALKSIISSLKEHEYLGYIAKYECRPKQITFEPVGLSSLDDIMYTMRNLVEKLGLLGVQILESSHSIDILAPGVSKLDLVKEVSLKAKKTKTAETLCIADRGKWPGNDFALLSGKYSLSVDTVSTDPDSCWNLAPLGHRGVRATLDYLKAIEIEKGLMHFYCNKCGSLHERCSSGTFIGESHEMDS